MARISEHHKAKCGVEGKCSRPMYQMGMECFCDEPAWGQQYAEGSKHAPQHWPQRNRNGFYPSHLVHLAPPYVPDLACAAHGGPRVDQIRFVRDGNMWCAFMPGFENLQESDAGFGETQAEAETNLARLSQQPEGIEP